MTTMQELGILQINDFFYSFRLPKDLMYELDALSKHENISKSELIRRGIHKVMQEYNWHRPGG